MTSTIDTAFLPLEYTRHHYGKPIEAQSEVVPHCWNEQDYAYIAAEFTIEADKEELYNDYDVYHVWVKSITRSLFHETADEAVTWWQSARFHTFDDAEAFAQFAYQRWQATGRCAAAGMEWRHDLDARRNPAY